MTFVVQGVVENTEFILLLIAYIGKDWFLIFHVLDITEDRVINCKRVIGILPALWPWCKKWQGFVSCDLSRVKDMTLTVVFELIEI